MPSSGHTVRAEATCKLWILQSLEFFPLHAFPGMQCGMGTSRLRSFMENDTVHSDLCQ